MATDDQGGSEQGDGGDADAVSGSSHGSDRWPERCRVEFVTGEASIRELARKYKGKPGCSPRSLARRSKEQEWVEQRYRHLQSIADRVAVAPPPPPHVPRPPRPPAEPAAPSMDAVAADRAIEKVADQVAEEVAAERLAERQKLNAARAQAIDAAMLMITRGTQFLAADKIRLRATGSQNADGSPEIELEQQGSRRISMTGRLNASSLVERGTQVLQRMGSLDFDGTAKRLELEMRELDARIKAHEAKADPNANRGPNVFLLPNDPDFAEATRNRLIDIWNFDRDGGRDTPPWEADAARTDGSDDGHGSGTNGTGEPH